MEWPSAMWQGQTCLALPLRGKQFQAKICCVGLCISWPNLHCQNASDVTCSRAHKLSLEFSFGLYLTELSRVFLLFVSQAGGEGHRDTFAVARCMGPPTASKKALEFTLQTCIS